MNILINGETGALSAAFRVADSTRDVVVQQSGMAAGETLVLEKMVTDSIYEDVIIDGTTQTLSSINTTISIVGPGNYRLTGTVAGTVYVSTSNNGNP